MDKPIDIQTIDARIQAIKKAAEEIKSLSGAFPAVARNTVRLMASVKMLELEVSDVVDLK